MVFSEHCSHENLSSINIYNEYNGRVTIICNNAMAFFLLLDGISRFPRHFSFYSMAFLLFLDFAFSPRAHSLSLNGKRTFLNSKRIFLVKANEFFRSFIYSTNKIDDKCLRSTHAIINSEETHSNNH